MRIPIDRQSSEPIFRQIAGWLRENILNGNLAAETKLPATRALAEKLGVSRITIKNAYALVESDGLILTREGSGTFVASPSSGQGLTQEFKTINWPLWQLEQGAEPVSAMIGSNANIQTSGMISFIGVGDPVYFPAKDFVKTLQDVVRRDGATALNYGNFGGGYEPLQVTITRVLASQGIQTKPTQVLVTSGSQQGLALVCHQLLHEGDVVLVEKPTYNLALELFRHLKLKIIGVPVDENGMQVEVIEPLLQQYHPKLIYTIPNFQNPTGTCLSISRRRLMLTLAQRYNVPILEDDFVGDLRFEGRALPAIKALDGTGQVIYIGTFSKLLMPGIRVGYLVANGPIFHHLVHQKMVNDLTTSPLLQRALDIYVTVGRYQAHLRRSTRIYRQRRDVLIENLTEKIPEVKFNTPHGGLFLWLKLPEGLSSQSLQEVARNEGVDFAPGSRFFCDPDEGKSCLRLNFATNSSEQILEGVKRLSRAVKQYRE